MQTTKQSTQNMCRSTADSKSNKTASNYSEQKLKNANSIKDSLQYLIPPHDKDSSCFLKSSN